MKSKFFTDPNLTFNETKSTLVEEDIVESIPFDFEGKKDFILFYTQYNGVVFPFGAFFYRDSFYEVRRDEYNLLDVGAFFEISNSENSILKMWESFKADLRAKDISSKYLPFGNDSSGNLFCIESKTGVVVYIQHENPKNITNVAPSFLDFCNKIQEEMR
ncbi:SMI1/KNR4 family protein [Cellulophaga sp. L1A9]|uniref:SMI1/KNR4 family protein n=1 Tax=Cellulophaga sp. L1A9 TaxID=2686362 RepID=UPI00131B8139|nr:SMI1/KNR4 family protein [Cellulophaga sp. L1A9]